jgi:hypothetical protein
VFFGSEIADGNAHGHRDMPILLAGQLGGTLETGRHVRYESEPLANVFMGLLDRLGVDVTSYGDAGTAPSPNLG